MSNLVERLSIKCFKKEVTRAASLEKKMNIQPQNDVVLAKCILSLWFLMSLNYTPDWLQTFNFVQFYPWQTSISAPDSSAFFILVLVLDLCNLTLNWPLNFQFSSISPIISINWVPIVCRLVQNGHWLRISLFWPLTGPKTLIFLQIYP